MHRHSKYIIASAIVLMATSAALSKDGGLPNLDIQKQCQKTQRATDEFTGTKNPNAFNLCVKTEQSAREKLAGRWATPRPWIKQPVFIRRVGHQAISNGLGALKQEITCERSARITRNLWPPRSCAQR